MMLVALLIALSCLGIHTLNGILIYAPWQAQNVSIQNLSLAPNTFDDAYVGCLEEMEEKAVHLLAEEMANHTRLRESWETAQKAWEQRCPGLSLPPGFKTQHGIAIMVYTNSSNPLYRELNQAVRTGGDSREFYMQHFPFKALHFYLTRALQLLRGSRDCSREPGQEREVLIPPHEVFLVTNFSQDGARNLVTLSSNNQMCSHFNCAYLGAKKRPSCESVPTGGQADSLSKGAFSLLSSKALPLASWGFQLLGAVL
ncbi:ecto-ADP-ribosyltransferase 5 isoform X3 [Physeter macrocephalus]|uniref:NAD(P)(+)--arginine ADP-ribosyltransferase n=1 Tax=Physeter macrocephalus TaxID=9755 RepID=A0A455AWQ7_PHYMC|nr:ecto-ADP-ribosyltransferase 5 isoform X3 [Physeter catodon]|eukprot:XP_028340977.1 ecto-ADP-ribosyltransferase 5 isoform X3 [Physeter catodon]